MTNTNSAQDLGKHIEQLIQEHIAASRAAAKQAVERAFASTAGVPAAAARPVKSCPGKRRASAEIAVLGERFYTVVCAKPGESMTVLAATVGASARELHRSVSFLRRAGRVRTVGSRQFTRYFPMTKGAAASA
jgi:hypothetical protein